MSSYFATGKAVVVALLLSLSAPTMTVLAFPTGPGGCAGGLSAATGHPIPNPIPSFAAKGYEFTIDGVVVTNPSTVTLRVGNTYVMSVRSTSGPFKGALIRVDGMGEIKAGQNAGIAAACTAIGIDGVAHTSNADKTSLSGSFTVAGGSSLVVDVTVVENFSSYSYQGFTFKVGAAVTAAPVRAPTKAPVRSPTAAPVRPPTKAPVPAPTGKPVTAPVVAPTGKPVTAPVVAPTGKPVSVPVVAPTGKPVSAPVVAPTGKPVTAPVVAPTGKPITAPTAPVPTAPVAAPTGPPVDKCVRRRKA